VAKTRGGLLIRMLDWLFGKPPSRPVPPRSRPTGLAPAPPALRGTLERAMSSKAVLQGRVSSVVKGGLLVDIGYDVRAFLPGSHIDIRRVPDFSVYLGRTIPVQVIEVDPRTADVVLSRRRVLEEERRQRTAARPTEPEPRHGRHVGARRGGPVRPPVSERATSVEDDSAPDTDDADHDWRPAAVRAGTSRLVVDISTAGDVAEVRKIVRQRAEAEAARGVSEILVRMHPGQKRELRSLVASGAIEAVDPRRSRQVQDGLVLVLVKREPEGSSHE